MRYESVITPEGGKAKRAATLVSGEVLRKGQTVKIGKTRWDIKVLVPAETERPHLGDLIASPITKTKRK